MAVEFARLGFERKPASWMTSPGIFHWREIWRRHIRRVKDPETLPADCAELGIPHPEFHA